MRWRSSLALRATSCACVVLAGLLAGPASARADEPRPTVLAEDLLSPLSLAVSDDGTVWFSQNYAGTLERRNTDGSTEVVARAPAGLELGAVAEQDGTVWYSVSGREETFARLHELTPDGTDTVVADLFAHERDTNPDGDVRYGFRDLPARCAADLPEADSAAYRGRLEAHPYAGLRAHGALYVADAAANAVLAVAGQDELDGRDVVTTVGVLPPVRTTMSQDYADENGLPDCTVGEDYWAEPVPTDVEAGPYGSFYVSTLPGGPGQLNGHPSGAVYRILALTGQVSVVATGLDHPTGLAVADNGDLYVCELQGGRISRIAAGTHQATAYASGISPGDVEWTPGGLLASLDVLSGTSGEAGDPPAGSVVLLN